MKKVLVAIGGLVFIGLVMVAARLFVPGAIADAKNGLSPFTAVPLQDGRNTGALAPGESRWYELRGNEQGGTFQRQAGLTLFFTPEDGNRAHRVHFQIFPANQITRWYEGDVSQMQNLGAGGVVSRDGNPVTGELLWSGWLVSSETYYVQVLDGTDVAIDYYLFTDDVVAAELGSSTPPQPATESQAEVSEDHLLAPAPTSDESTGADAGDLLPLASELQSDHALVETEVEYVSDGTPTRLVIPAISLDSKIVPVGGIRQSLMAAPTTSGVQPTTWWGGTTSLRDQVRWATSC